MARTKSGKIRRRRSAPARVAAGEALALCRRVVSAHEELTETAAGRGIPAARAAYLERFEERLVKDPKAAVNEYDRWKRCQVHIRGLSGEHALRDAWIAKAVDLYMKNQRAEGGSWPGIYESADRLLCAVQGVLPENGERYQSAVEAMGEKMLANGKRPVVQRAYRGDLNIGRGAQAAIIVMVALTLGITETKVRRAVQRYGRQNKPREHSDTPQ